MTVIRFDKEDNGLLDKLFISLIHSTLFCIVIIHLLALMKLYETLSLFAVYLLTIIAITRFKNKSDSVDAGTKVLTSGLDVFEKQGNWKIFLKAYVMKIIENRQIEWRKFLNSFRIHWFPYICIFATLVYAAFTRFKHSLIHLYFGSSDAYVHLRLTKYLGDNKIFGDGGLYPYGYAAVISALNKFFIMDPYIIIRYIGPFCGFLIVLSIIFALKKMIGAHYAVILIGLFIYVVSTDIPTNLWRQISALSMEYAVIFLLPGIVFLIEFFRKEKQLYLIIAAECLAITLFIHLYTAAALGCAYILISLCYWRVTFASKKILRFMIVMVTSGIVGLLPLMIGYMTLPPLGDFTYLNESLKPVQNLNLMSWANAFLSTSSVIKTLIIATFILLTYKLFDFLKNRKNHLLQRNSDKAEIVLLLIFIVFYIIYDSGAYGFPVIIPADRFCVFFALTCAIASAVIFKNLIVALPFIRDHNILKTILVLIIAGSVLWSGKVNSAPIGVRYQYDDAVKAFMQIKKEFSALNWTIISTGEENPLIINYGWHSQIWEFIQTISHPEGKKLIFPTDEIFIFVEKIPLGSDKEITDADAIMPFPEFTGKDLTEFYYRDVVHRKILEAKAYKWAENHRKYRDMKIYYDSPDFRVYWIRQDGAHPQDLLK
jgi:hypothetical protein